VVANRAACCDSAIERNLLHMRLTRHSLYVM
jgi:hypothetical protein